MSRDLDKHLANAIKNIEEDREVTRELLDDVMRLLAKDEENHKYAGQVAAKYVETLQRSNEQLVKIVGMLQKESAAAAAITELDKNSIFDLLQNDKESN
jgi:hypothetical protein